MKIPEKIELAISFEQAIDEVGALYEDLKGDIRAMEFGYASKRNLEEWGFKLAKLRDYACVALQRAYQPFHNHGHKIGIYMNKYELPEPQFLAQQYTGDIDPLIAACEEVAPGSTAFTWTEATKVATFTDANGNPATLNPNDWVQQQTTPTAGWLAVPAAIAAIWVAVAS